MKTYLAYIALAFTLTVTALAAPSIAQDEAKGEPTLAEVPAARATTASPIRTASPKIRPLKVTVDLVSNTAIVGTLTDITNLDCKRLSEQPTFRCRKSPLFALLPLKMPPRLS